MITAHVRKDSQRGCKRDKDWTITLRSKVTAWLIWGNETPPCPLTLLLHISLTTCLPTCVLDNQPVWHPFFFFFFFFFTGIQSDRLEEVRDHKLPRAYLVLVNGHHPKWQFVWSENHLSLQVCLLCLPHPHVPCNALRQWSRHPVPDGRQCTWHV